MECAAQENVWADDAAENFWSCLQKQRADYKTAIVGSVFYSLNMTRCDPNLL